MSIELNRHHMQRIKEKHLNDHYLGSYVARKPKNYKTPTPCSCWMCGNPRRYFGQMTIQEKRMFQEVE